MVLPYLVARRVVSSLVAVIGASILGFMILRVFPANPARLIVGPLAPQEAVDAQVRQLGLDKPLTTQYFDYIGQFVRGDWGYSYSAGQAVTTLFATRIAATAELALCAFLLSFGAAIVFAVASTYRRRPVLDGSVRSVAFLGMGTPPFWLGLILLVIFFSNLGILPGPEGRLSVNTSPPPALTHLYTVDALLAGQVSVFVNASEHLVLPVIALALAPFAYLVRLLRLNMLEASREPFVLVARSKGLHRWTVSIRHVLPNAFLPTLTASGIILAQLLAGSVLIEKTFAWPGIGALVSDSILVQDYSVVQTFILLSAVLYVVVNLVVDVLYGVIDPRVRRPSAVG